MIKENDANYKKYLKLLGNGVEIRVGILSKGSEKHRTKAARNREMTIAALATIHEFGLGQKERSFIRGWFDAQNDEVLKIIYSQMIWSLKNNQRIHTGAERAAIKLAASCQARMVKGWTYEDISDITKKRKKSSTPLIDTGVLKSAIVGEAIQL